jgi:hypothetical protein
MKRPLWSILVLIFFVPVAHADTFVNATLDFTVSQGGPTPTGSFVFDYTTDHATPEAITGYLFDIATNRMALSANPEILERSTNTAKILAALRPEFETH